MNIWINLHALRLISRTLKLITKKTFSGPEISKIQTGDLQI
jgi:hypothetical protein